MSKKLGKLASRYAHALRIAVLEELGDNGEHTPSEQVAEQLSRFAELWTAQQLHRPLLNPMFSKEDRKKSVVVLLKQLGALPVLERFLLVLIDRDRLGGVVEIAEAFQRIAEDARGAVRVSVETARAIESSERVQMERELAQKIGGKPQFQWEVRPELLGGLVVRYQGKVLDGSVSGRLERLEQSLKAATI